MDALQRAIMTARHVRKFASPTPQPRPKPVASRAPIHPVVFPPLNAKAVTVTYSYPVHGVWIAAAELSEADSLRQIKTRLRGMGRLGIVQRIQHVVCHRYHVNFNELISQRRHASIVRARHIAYWLCRELSKRSLPEIGRLFGKRDHTTILHGTNVVSARIRANAEYAHEIAELECMLKEIIES